MILLVLTTVKLLTSITWLYNYILKKSWGGFSMRSYNGKYINDYIQCHATLSLAYCFECIPCQWYISGTTGPELRDFEWSGHSWTAMEVIVMHTTF